MTHRSMECAVERSRASSGSLFSVQWQRLQRLRSHPVPLHTCDLLEHSNYRNRCKGNNAVTQNRSTSALTETKAFKWSTASRLDRRSGESWLLIKSYGPADERSRQDRHPA
jgi:hypothetical protein